MVIFYSYVNVYQRVNYYNDLDIISLSTDAQRFTQLAQLLQYQTGQISRIRCLPAPKHPKLPLIPLSDNALFHYPLVKSS